MLERFLEAVPEKFLKTLLERQGQMYRQSMDIALADVQPWSRAEALNVLPHIRRAVWEQGFRSTSIECGLKAFDLAHNGKNATCVHVKAKRLILTTHFVSTPGEFVREAESRKQNAGVNRWLSHYVDQRLLTYPVPKLDDKPIYINLLHGAVFPTTNKSESDNFDVSTCFIQIAIPAADSKQYLPGCVWNAQELLQHYAATEQTAAEPEVKIADRAIPRTKKKDIS